MFDTQKLEAVSRLWLLANDRYIATIKVQAKREDVALALGTPLAEFAGFAFALRNLPADWTLCQFSLLAEYRDGTFGRLPLPGCTGDN